MARYACVSRQRLQELFHLHLRMDPRNYLLQFRMESAKRLLAKGKLTFAEAGRLVGYANPRSFKRFYRRQAGSAPAPGRAPS